MSKTWRPAHYDVAWLCFPLFPYAPEWLQRPVLRLEIKITQQNQHPKKYVYFFTGAVLTICWGVLYKSAH